MTATTSEFVEQPAAEDRPAPPPRDRTAARIALRWLLIVTLTLVAFWPSLMSLYQTTLGSGLNGYAWLVLVAGVLAAQGVARRPRRGPPIHDRQTDVIVGIMGMGFALLLCGVLMRRYGMWFHLLRFDLLGMWTFVLSACVLLFGLRPVTRYTGVWLLTLAVFPLPYQVMVIVLGGGRAAGAVTSILIAAAAAAIAVGRGRRALLAACCTVPLGIAGLFALNAVAPKAAVVAYQVLPALAAMLIVLAVDAVLSHRTATPGARRTALAPPATTSVWSMVPLLLVVTFALTLVKLPAPGSPPVSRFDAMPITGPLLAPEGWQVTRTEDYPWVKRLHGSQADLTRQRMVADAGNLKWDKLSRPRTVVVDNVMTDRPFSFYVYPAKVLYDVTATRLSQVRRVDLGYGVTGELMSGVDDHELVTWNMMQWTWRNGARAQRVLVFTVDNHEDDAPFPQPSGALLPTLNTLVTVLFRGNSAVDDDHPEFKDADLLTVFSRDLVSAQLQPLGIAP